MSSGALKEHHPESLHFLLLFLFPLCLPIMSISSTSFNTTTMAIIIATTVACFLRWGKSELVRPSNGHIPTTPFNTRHVIPCRDFLFTASSESPSSPSPSTTTTRDGYLAVPLHSARFNNTSDSIERKRLISVGNSKGAINNKATCCGADRLPWRPAGG